MGNTIVSGNKPSSVALHQNHAIIITLIPLGRISYPNTIPKHIGPMMIYTKFDQYQIKTVGEVFLGKNKLLTTNNERTTTTDEVGSVKLTWTFGSCKGSRELKTKL